MKKKITKGILFACSICFSAGMAQAQEAADTSTFKPGGNVWGYVFGDYAAKTQNDTLGRGAGNVQYKGAASLNSGNVQTATNPVPANVQSNAFQIRRAYLGYDYNISRTFTATVVLANEQTLLANNQNTTYLKYAFLKWNNIWKNTNLVLGQYQTCSFASGFGTEPLWGYRSSERTLLDMHNIDGSTDLGASLEGRIWTQKNPSDDKKPALVGYILQVGNGASATPATTQFKKVRANVFTALFNQKLVIGLYADYLVQQLSPYHTSNTTYKAYANLNLKRVHLGFEMFQQTNQNSDIYKVYNAETKKWSTNDTASGVQIGVSVFGSVSIIKKKLNFFARYDMFNPDNTWNTNNSYSKAYSGITGSNMTSATFYTQKFVNIGFDWTPDPRIHLMPNFWYNSYNSDMSSAGPDGTGKAYGTRVVRDEDIVYRLTFYYIFNGAKKVSNNGFY